MKVKSGDQEFYMDEDLMNNLDIAKDIVTKDWDCFFIIDGQEGTGKSKLATQIAKYCDPTFNHERMCITPDEFLTQVKKAKKKQAVVLDEADIGLSSRRAMSKTNWALNSVIAQIRQKNLFGFIVCPSFYFIDRRISVFRSRALIHVYHRHFQRGYFTFYNYDRKLTLYLKYRDYLAYPKIYNLHGRFPNTNVIDWKKYLERKSMIKYEDEESQNKDKTHRDSLVRWLNKEKKMKATEIAKGLAYGNELKVTRAQVYTMLRNR